MANTTIEMIDDALRTATEQHRAGHLAEARRLYEQVLEFSPAHTIALFRSGLLELHCGQVDVALARMRLAVAAAPSDARYHFGLGQALQASQRWSEAVHAFESTLRLDPDFPVLNDLGMCLQRSGRVAAAAAAYRRALVLRPGDAAVMANLGTALREMGELPEAVERLRGAAALEPQVISHGINLGIALCQQREFAAAEELLRRTVALEPGNPEAAFNLGIAQNGLGKPLEAIGSYRLAVASRPGYTDALVNLGNALSDVGEFNAALSAYDAALLGRPDSVVALNNAACLLRTLGRIEEAESKLLAGLRIDPGYAALHDNLGNVCKDAGQLDRAIEYFRRALELDPTSAATHSNLAYALCFQSLEPRPLLEECKRWNQRFALPLTARRVHSNPTGAHRRLRIGYVSADFRDHCQSLFTVPLLSRHDHSAFDIFCYSSVKRPDALTARIAGYADVWREVRHLDDQSLSERIGADGIDILVDLTMHMADGRPLLFARKPAPIQVAWLAYPGTTGISAIDYRLSDPRLDPQGTDGDYSERTLRLADSFWCYDPLTDTPATNPLPALGRSYLTLGCLNNPCKLTDHTLRLWGAVASRLPGARFLLMAPPGRYRQHLLQRFGIHGIEAERISFTPFRPRGAYLSAYQDIDLGLDTFPYNGHTTSFDSLWMGVPVVTRVGQTCVGRAGLSQLHHLNLLDLAADTDAAFIDAAVALGTDLDRLSALRGGLRTRLERSPLMDASAFTRQVESAYRLAWETYCRRATPV